MEGMELFCINSAFDDPTKLKGNRQMDKYIEQVYYAYLMANWSHASLGLFISN